MTSYAIRQGFRCPECGCIKDAYEPAYNQTRLTAWCHNYRHHGRPMRRKMDPVALTVGWPPREEAAA